MSQARKHRRAMAKAFGYTNKNETLDQFRKRVLRAHEVGKQLHTLHLERNMNEELERGRILIKQQEEKLIENNKSTNSGEISLVNQEAFSFLNSSNTPGPEASPLDLGNPESND